jgi:hypothetical protein
MKAKQTPDAQLCTSGGNARFQSRWSEATLKDVASLRRGHDLTDSLRREGDVPVMSAAGQGHSDKIIGRVLYEPDKAEQTAGRVIYSE